MIINNNTKDTCEVLLINPPSSKGRVKRGSFFTPPIGLTYVASVLLKRNVSIKIIDCDPENLFIDPENATEEQKDSLFLKFKQLNNTPLIIGIGPCTTPNLLNNIAIAKYSKQFFNESLIIMGGPHMSVDIPLMAYKMLEEYAFIDGVVIGEGEDTIIEVFNKVKNRKSLEYIAGFIYRNNKSNFIPRLLIKDLNSIPFPERFLLRDYFQKYKIAVRRVLPLFNKLKNEVKLARENIPFTVIFSSRGCPFRCNFCCSSKKRRLRSPENVIAEIEDCIRNYGINFYIFYDDLFSTYSIKEKERVLKICELIEKKELKIYWEVELRVDVICKLGKSILKKMNENGCIAINIGIEKTSQEGLDFINKGIKEKNIQDAINIIRDSGEFTINGTFILGGEGETRESLKKLIKSSLKLGLDNASFYPLEIHPGTELFRIAKRKGIINDFWEPYQFGKKYPLYITNELSRKDLLDYKRLAFRSFYFRMDYLKKSFRKIGSKYIFLFLKEYLHILYHAFFENTWYEKLIPNKLKEIIFSL